MNPEIIKNSSICLIQSFARARIRVCTLGLGKMCRCQKLEFLKNFDSQFASWNFGFSSQERGKKKEGKKKRKEKRRKRKKQRKRRIEKRKKENKVKERKRPQRSQGVI